MKKILVGLFLAVTLILFRFYFNSSKENSSFFQGVEMTLPYTIKIGSPLSSEARNKADLIIKNAFKMVNSTLNKENKDSELSRLNKLPANTAVSISEELERVFLLADRVYILTRGLFDPTIEPVLTAWKQKLGSGAALSSADIEKIRSSIGWNKIHFKGRVFYKENSALEIDLGGIIKGYLVEVLAQILLDEGYDNIFVEWGGCIMANGKQEDGQPWKAPITPNDGTENIELDGFALATVRASLPRWKVLDCQDKNAFCRLINPRLWTLQQNTVCKAAVKLSSCSLADGIATALTLADTEKSAENLAESIKKELKEGEFWIDTGCVNP